MTPAAPENRTTADAVRQLSERITQLELGQAQIVGRLDAMTGQLTTACSEMKSVRDRTDDHETRLTVREVAYEERIKPAIEQLRHLELKVAASAVGGGALVSVLIEVIQKLVQ